ncbi:MAG: hypothetical protein MUO18_04525, partial [Methanomassiliicoccales archaeon]|nr:hypothetical protein [Methanomassiliicoccales archaeon]
ADDDLLDEVKDNYGELSFRELNSALLKLELNGVLRVTRLMKGKRRVELVGIKSMRRLGIQLPVLATNICPSAFASEPPPRAFPVEEPSDVELLYHVRSSGGI